MTITFGEYYDEVYAWAEKYNTNGAIFMEDWFKIDSGVSWAEGRAMELSEGLVRAFSHDMQIYFQEALNSIGTESLYYLVKQEGHSFLMAAHSIAEKMGIEMDVSEFDQPLTISDLLIATGLARP